MIIKEYLPFRYSREGCVPDQIIFKQCKHTAEQCKTNLLDQKRTAHFHIGEDGCITAWTPLSAAANLLGPTGTDPDPASEQLPLARRGILILIETKNGNICKDQWEPLLRLLKRIQKEVFRIYGIPFPFSRNHLILDSDVSIPLETLLEDAVYYPEYSRIFRVLTGSYRNRREAEESIQRLSNAGIAAYITEVTEV